jgi:hypothetical protein
VRRQNTHHAGLALVPGSRGVAADVWYVLVSLSDASSVWADLVLAFLF